MTAAASPTAADPAFVVQLDAYSGPLDLLLSLIRQQEIDIADIPIAQVADQFLAALQTLGLDDAADYLEMAALLLRIKIQMLLPRPFDDEGWEDPRAELVRRLLEYEQIREVAAWMVERAAEHADRFPRGWLPELPELPLPPIDMALEELLLAAERVVEGIPEPILHRVVPRPLDVEGATRRVEALLESRAEITLGEAIGEHRSVADVLSVLIAILELARLGRLSFRQKRPFAAVVIRRESARSAA